jgi:acetoin utilization protein AcuB
MHNLPVMNLIPRVAKYMTWSPLTIGADRPMALAHKFMRSHRLRHLPVLRGGRIVGIVSDGDLHLIETLQDVDPNRVTVEEAMTQEPYCVSPDEPLDSVVAGMAEHKYGCVVIVQDGKAVGIFTTVDACRAFADLLRETEASATAARRPPPDPREESESIQSLG